MNEELVRAVAQAAKHCCCPQGCRYDGGASGPEYIMALPCGAQWTRASVETVLNEIYPGLIAGTHAVVPREPTDAMLEAACGCKNLAYNVDGKTVYKAMLAAAERDDG